MITIPAVLALFVLFYHYERNGTPLNEGDFLGRIFWGLAFGLGTVVLNGLPSDILSAAELGASAAIGGYLMTLVPHAFAQNMGELAFPYNLAPPLPTPFSKYWPALPFTKTQDTWNSMSRFKRGLFDARGMFCAGIFQGFAMFAPLFVVHWAFPDLPGIDLVGFSAGAFVNAIGQPLAYGLGRLIPFTLWGNNPHSSEWGEFWAPAGFLAALYTALVLG